VHRRGIRLGRRIEGGSDRGKIEAMGMEEEKWGKRREEEGENVLTVPISL
jgi:hypothetical protein